MVLLICKNTLLKIAPQLVYFWSCQCKLS